MTDWLTHRLDVCRDEGGRRAESVKQKKWELRWTKNRIVSKVSHLSEAFIRYCELLLETKNLMKCLFI